MPVDKNFSYTERAQKYYEDKEAPTKEKTTDPEITKSVERYKPVPLKKETRAKRLFQEK